MREAPIKKCFNHLQYFNEKYAVFSISDDRIDDKTKYKMAKEILGLNEKRTKIDKQEKDQQNKTNLRSDNVQYFYAFFSYKV